MDASLIGIIRMHFNDYLSNFFFYSWMENNLIERISEGIFQNSTSTFEL